MFLENLQTLKKIDVVVTDDEKIEIFFELEDFIENIENKSENLDLFGRLIEGVSLNEIGDKLIELSALDLFVDLFGNFNILKL